jgi:hypothetical protein
VTDSPYPELVQGGPLLPVPTDVTAIAKWVPAAPPVEVADARNKYVDIDGHIRRNYPERLLEVRRAGRVTEWHMVRRWPANETTANRTDDRPQLHRCNSGCPEDCSADRVAWNRLYDVGQVDLDWLLDPDREPQELTQERVRQYIESRNKRNRAVMPHDLRRGDFRHVLADLDGRVDAVITDPPYGAEYVPLLDDLSEHAARWLRPGGVLAVMFGHAYLPDVYRRLGQHLRYYWTIGYVMGGEAVRLWQHRVITGWKPVLVYTKGDYDGPWFYDTARSTANDKMLHQWGQSESGMASLIEKLTEPGDLICDPFLGAGTTAAVAGQLGRSCVGCDLDWSE